MTFFTRTGRAWAARFVPALLGLCVLAAPLGAGSQTLQPRIANGVSTTDQPTTGALLLGSGGFQSCSGTLIGCRTFLTAAHCVCDENGSTCNPNESSYQVFLQHEGVFQVSQITPHPSYIDFPSAANDIAVITLSTFADGIRPTPLASTPPPFGTSGTIVGFGTLNDAPLMGSGIKRQGTVVTTGCAPSGASDSQFICWEFTPPFGPPGTDSNTCPGDSGGPMFTSESGETVISGVTSFGLNACAGDDFAGDANVATYASWVASVAGSDVSQASCGALPQVGDPDVQVHGFDGFLSGAGAQGVHSFNVLPSALELRVTLNGQDDGLENFDLWVRFGAPPSAGQNDCEAETSSQFEACTFAAPTPGTWYAMARSSAGSGSYQITGTSFGGSAVCGDLVVDPPETCDDGNTLPGDGCDEVCRIEPACGNGILEPGEACDDGNLVAGDGCNASCGLEPPVCGNGVVQSGEACDDGNTLPGDGCDGFCQREPGCGDGTLETPEQCDDGNTVPGDGCSELCRLEPTCGNGNLEDPETCDDGNTIPGDGCDATCQTETVASACGPTPAATCQAPQQSGSRVKLRRGASLGKSRLQWRWKSVPVADTDLGDPRIDTGYRLCVYDEVAGTASLVLEAEAPAGPQWSVGSKGLRFKGSKAAGSLERLRVRAGSQLKLTAKARSVPTLPMSQDASVIVQLHNDRGTCWESRFTAPARKNDVLRFVDR